MNFPSELRYTKEHEWVKLIEENVALVGVTDFAQSELGDIVFVEVETVGSGLEANEVFGTVEAVKTVSDLFLPVSGTVLEFNKILVDTPEQVNEDPYGNGWIIKLEINDLASLETLLDADEYKKEIGQ